MKIYNTLTRQKEELKPLKAPQVSIYVCGPTVYDLLHIGNFRGYVFFNLVRNWLEELGYKPQLAVNFTDVDDKIIDRAKKLNSTSSDVSEKFIQECKQDFKNLKLRPHTLNPKVTETMPEIVQFINSLIKKEHAYAVGGDVFYSIEKFSGYGKLSGRKTDELLTGVRIDVEEKKKSPLDFALWKSAKPEEPSWPSPWGPGRPGWHIECSAMIHKHFGDQIDIHGGGIDLIFPHHENEVAQTEGFTGKNFAQVWMHWNMLNLSGMKMSKSLGNILSLREFLQEYHPEIYKWMILSVHYRSPLEFGEESIHRAIANLGRVYSALALGDSYLQKTTTDGTVDTAFQKYSEQMWSKVSESLSDDFGTPEVIAVVFDVIRNFNAQVKPGMKPNQSLISKCLILRDFFRKLGSLFSLFEESPSEFLITLDDRLLKKMNLSRDKVDQLVAQRWQKRLAKDFAAADQLREELTQMGIQVSDGADKSYWEVKK